MKSNQSTLNAIATLTATLNVIGLHSPIGTQIQKKIADLVKKV